MLTEARTHSPHAARTPHASGTAGAHYSGPPVEQLAHESGHSLEFVQDLYKRELMFLEHDARIHSYIPVLAMKRVRAALRGNRSAAHAHPRVRPHPTGHQLRHERPGNGGR